MLPIEFHIKFLFSTLPGRLSKQEIERMVSEAEKYKQEDDKRREGITARNELESFVDGVKTAVEDDRFKDKITDDEKTKLIEECNTISNWLDHNQVNSGVQMLMSSLCSLLTNPYVYYDETLLGSFKFV